jgi:hypothetical protein
LKSYFKNESLGCKITWVLKENMKNKLMNLRKKDYEENIHEQKMATGGLTLILLTWRIW